MQTLKLYEIPPQSKIKTKQGFITFHRLDGLYSYCIAEWLPDTAYRVVHLHANTELKKVGDHYELAEGGDNDDLTPTEAAKLLGVHPSMVSRYFLTGIIQGQKNPDGGVVISKAGLEGFDPKNLTPEQKRLWYAKYPLKNAKYTAMVGKVKAKQAAKLLSCSDSLVYKLAKVGVLNGIKHGSRLYIYNDSISKFIAAGKKMTREQTAAMREKYPYSIKNKIDQPSFMLFDTKTAADRLPRKAREYPNVLLGLVVIIQLIILWAVSIR